MPELPEVETVVRGLRPVLEGQILTNIIQRRPDLRFPIPENLVHDLKGAKLLTIQRRAKYILADTDRGQSLMVHLGMSGRMTIQDEKSQDFQKHDHLIFETANHQIRYNDARRFGFVDLFPSDAQAKHPRLTTLGPEPLGNEFSGPYLFQGLAKLKSPIKTAIMDQKRVVGVGNIYACESLFKAGIHPELPAGQLGSDQCEALVSAIKSTLKRAIEAGGSSLNDYVQASGELGYFQHEWRVYGREGEACYACGTAIERIIQAQRSSFYCKSCQSA